MEYRWIRNAVLLVVLGSATTACAQAVNHQHEWTYGGEEGPEHWGDLKSAYSTCKNGKEQSPIDIRNVAEGKLPAIHFEYKNSPLKIINNGHTIQVNYAPGSFIAVGDKRYELKQFHFHHPSEERLAGRSYDMVIHLVHADTDGKLAVVAILLKNGDTNSAIQELWAHLPKSEGKEQEIAGIQANAAALLPQDTAYYTYNGSLTTPPCSEGVTWFVMKTPTDISSGQTEAFAKIYPNNARPIQAISGRIVKGTKSN
jgi:carbonic anhydrase